MSTADYIGVESRTPAALRHVNGEWYVEIIVSKPSGVTEFITAPIGPDFVRQCFEKVVMPKLRG